jgi:hypothetical protein
MGLQKLSRNQQQVDFQSAAGFHPCPQTNVSRRLDKVAARKETDLVIQMKRRQAICLDPRSSVAKLFWL